MEEKTQKGVSNSISKTLHGDTARERLLHRAHAVTLVLSGVSSSQVGRIYGDSPRAVAYWVTRFKKEGLDGLQDEAKPGRPSTLTSSQISKLQKHLSHFQEESESKKAEKSANYILKEFGITLTVRQCWRILKRLKA